MAFTLTISCQQATRLIEERADRRLPLATSATLAFHLLYCPYCKRYAAQSPLIGQLALFGTRRVAASAEVQLPVGARTRIQQRLDAARGGAQHSGAEL